MLRRAISPEKGVQNVITQERQKSNPRKENTLNETVGLSHRNAKQQGIDDDDNAKYYKFGESSMTQSVDLSSLPTAPELATPSALEVSSDSFTSMGPATQSR